LRGASGVPTRQPAIALSERSDHSCSPSGARANAITGEPGSRQCGKRLRTFELQDVESGVVVGEVHHALRIEDRGFESISLQQRVGNELFCHRKPSAARRRQRSFAVRFRLGRMEPPGRRGMMPATRSSYSRFSSADAAHSPMSHHRSSCYSPHSIDQRFVAHRILAMVFPGCDRPSTRKH
jgi:hypothetical protein